LETVRSNTKTSSFRGVVNYIGLQVGWLACALGAAWGYAWVGPLVVAGHLVIHFLWIQNRRQEILFLLVVAIFGTLVDSIQKATGLLSYASDIAVPWVAPLWITAMWVLFATAMTTSLSWLQGRYWLAIALGVIFGPLSYVAGERLNGVEFNYGFWFTVFVMGVIWAVVMVGLSWLAQIKNRW
jgi:hypothetical protein